MGELKKRVLVGLLLAPVTACLFYFLPPLWFLIFLIIVAFLATYELATMTKSSQKYLLLFLVIIAFVPLYLRFSQLYLMWLITSTVIYLSAEIIMGKAKREGASREISEAVIVMLMAQLFIVLPFFYMYLLKELNGYLPLILLFAVWASDICAYFAGKAFGKTLLVPQISPKKTYEGLMGAIFGSMLIVVLMGGPSGMGIIKSLIIGAAIGLLGQLGDILESMGKRVTGVKDSSSLIPGHGGILDRMDSFIFTAPFLYNYLA